MSWWERFAFGFSLLLLIPFMLMAVYRFAPPPATPLMVWRVVTGAGLDQRWRGLDEVSPHLIKAVMAAEDAKFCDHDGFDWDAVENAIAQSQRGGRLVGASTISMQTAKNLFLVPSRSFVRKALEAYLTFWLEVLWPKDRIMEVYLNIAEWGPGVYGAEAAAQYHFNVSAARLSRRQAALLAAGLPNPRVWRPGRPGPYVSRRASTLQARMRSVRLGESGLCP